MWQVMLDPTTPATDPLPWLWQAENEARALRAEYLPAVVLFVPARTYSRHAVDAARGMDEWADARGGRGG